MISQYVYKPKGVCSSLFQFELEEDRIVSLQVQGGCNGNLKGISALIKGQKIEDVIQKLQGIHCGPRSTSCPDQIAKALSAYLENR